MRLIACAFSAVLLSGCSWMGFGGGSHQQGYNQQSYGAQTNVRYGSGNAQYNTNTGRRATRAPMGRCQITAPTQRIPQGCSPEQVTLAVGGHQGYGYNNGQNQYTSGGYGSHAQNTQNSTQYHTPQQRLRKPKLRGSLGLEIDHSVSGDLYDPAVSAAVAAYDRSLFAEGSLVGSVGDGAITRTTTTSSPERVLAPNISFDDVYTAPLRLTGGLEYIFNDHTTVFANAGYTRAEGKKGGGTAIIDELRRYVGTETYVTDPATQGGALGDIITPMPPIANQPFAFIPNEIVATFDYEFNDLERIDLEAGVRHYFSPILKSQTQRPITPFVSASAGAAHYSQTSVAENQRQRFIGRAFDNTQTNPDGDFYDVNFGATTQIYDAQWVPYGALKGGVEWQMTPKTALAFEAGVKYEDKRDFSDGTQGDAIISIPVAIRGSYNF